MFFFFFQAEDGIRYLVRSRGLGDVYKRQGWRGLRQQHAGAHRAGLVVARHHLDTALTGGAMGDVCLLYTSDAADERSSVDLGGRRIIKKKQTQKKKETRSTSHTKSTTKEHMHTQPR